MRTFTTTDIAPNIESLIAFIGQERIKKSISSWQNSIQNSPQLIRDHRLQESFYWWPGFSDYLNSQQLGTPYSMKTLQLAKDATKVLDVLETMPDSIKAKYAGALGDVRNAPTHLFEISMAHHFMSFGYKIKWIEDIGRGIAEFIVVTPTIEFEVECKHITVNAGRLIAREEFSRFGALIETQLRKRRLGGTIRVIINDRLPKPLQDLGEIVATVTPAIDSGIVDGQIEFPPWGTAIVELAKMDDLPIDWDAAQAQMRSSAPHQGHALARADSINGRPTNLIMLTLESIKPDEHLKAIYGTLKGAADRQLSKLRPGLLCVHIPEINDFGSMADESGLRKMTAYFFSNERHNHVSAISYSSDTHIISEDTGYQFTNDALAFKNAVCRFPGANEIRLFGHESAAPKLATSELEQMKDFDTNN